MNENLREWHDNAPFWDKHAATIRQMLAPLTEALIEDASIVTGNKVLDIAGGAGEPSVTIAEVVGPSGSVTFTDPIAKMVSAAQFEARRRGLVNLEFQQCAAESLPFASESFDAVVCRLGAMFFVDPLTALGEMMRVAKPAGSLALAVWYKSELNPYCYEVTQVVSRYIPPSADAVPTYDAFRFAEPGKLAAILQHAGAIDVRERILQFDIAAPISLEEFWEMRTEVSGTLREKLQAAPSDVRRQIEEDALNATAKYFPHNHMKFPAQMLLVSGTKPW